MVTPNHINGLVKAIEGLNEDVEDIRGLLLPPRNKLAFKSARMTSDGSVAITWGDDSVTVHTVAVVSIFRTKNGSIDLDKLRSQANLLKDGDGMPPMITAVLPDVLLDLIDEIGDVEALKATIESQRYNLKEAGVEPDHCTSCGMPIDVEWCHCGERCDQHAGGFDSHSPVPMGCVCGYLDLPNAYHADLAKAYLAGGTSPPINEETTPTLARAVITSKQNAEQWMAVAKARGDLLWKKLRELREAQKTIAKLRREAAKQ